MIVTRATPENYNTIVYEMTAIDSTQTNHDEALQQRGTIPQHIAVIMDGNGRWAKERGLDRVIGHHEGVESVRDITEACARLGVKYLTLYTFSTENWYRPSNEVDALMQLLVHTLRSETETLQKNNIRLQVIGDLNKLPDACRAEVEDAIEATAKNTRMTLVMAMSYSGRWEILETVRGLVRSAQKGDLVADEIDETLFSQALMTRGIPDPDLLIRTGGDFRVSNFLLWQIAYTEIYIADTYWPDFRTDRLHDAIRDFQNRERRFGRV